MFELRRRKEQVEGLLVRRLDDVAVSHADLVEHGSYPSIFDAWPASLPDWEVVSRCTERLFDFGRQEEEVEALFVLLVEAVKAET